MDFVFDEALDLIAGGVCGIGKPDPDGFHPFLLALGPADFSVGCGIHPSVSLYMGGIGDESFFRRRKEASAGLRRIRAVLLHQEDLDRFDRFCVTFRAGFLSVLCPSHIAEAGTVHLIVDVVRFRQFPGQPDLDGFQSLFLTGSAGLCAVLDPGIVPSVSLHMSAVFDSAF